MIPPGPVVSRIMQLGLPHIMTRIAVTELEYDKAQEVFTAASPACQCLRAPRPESALAEFVRQNHARHVIVGTAAYLGPLYEALPPGGVVARFGVGHDGLNKALATAHRLLCTNTPGVLDQSVAEYTLGLILAAARHIPRSAGATRQGQWQPILGRQLRGKQLAIIGCGHIGRRVARIAAQGLGMHVVGCVRERRPSLPGQDSCFEELTANFGRAVRDADFVSLHLPGDPSTHHFINAERLRAIPARAWLINTARGSVVDESALYDALAGGQLAGAALDVFEHEPYTPVAPGKDLRALENVIVMPHSASSTHEACGEMARCALQNIVLAEAGRYEEMDLLNPEVLPHLKGTP